MVSPLGSGVETCWQRLIEGKCGIRALCADDLKMDGIENETLLHTLEQLPSQVVAALPYGTGPGEFDAEYWLHPKVRVFFNAELTQTTKLIDTYIFYGSVCIELQGLLRVK